MNAHNTTICVVSLVQNVYYTLKFTTQNQNHWVQTNIFSDNNDCTKLEFNVAASQCHLRQFWGDFVFDSMPGWHKLWQAGKRLARTTEFVRTKSLARLSSVGLRPSSVLTPKNQKTLHFCCRNAKCFCSKKLDLRHFIRECRENLNIRILRTKFRIPCNLCRPVPCMSVSNFAILSIWGSDLDCTRCSSIG